MIGLAGWAAATAPIGDGRNDAELAGPVIAAALRGEDVDLIVTASSEFLTGVVGTVMPLFDVLPAWPPKQHTHLEGDGAFALHEAWLRLLAGGGRRALVCAWGRPLAHRFDEVLALQLDPYDPRPVAAAGAAIPLAAGAAAVVLEVGAGVPIVGIEQRVESADPRRRDLTTSTSTRAASEALGLPGTAVDLLAVHVRTEGEVSFVVDAVGAHVGRVDVPVEQVPMVEGLRRVITVAEAGGGVAHATNGPHLQHNLLCVLGER
jgi:hypothetical protein